MRFFILIILGSLISFYAKANSTEAVWRYLSDGFWGYKGNQSCKINSSLAKFDKSGYITYEEGKVINKGEIVEGKPFVKDDTYVNLNLIEQGKSYKGRVTLRFRSKSKIRFGFIISSDGDKHLFNRATMYRCKNISQQDLIKFSDLTKKKDKQAAKEYRQRDAKFKNLIGDPVKFLQGKWAFSSDGCDGDFKTVFIGNKTYAEQNGKPMFGLKANPFTVKRNVSSLVVETGNFGEKEVASSWFNFIVESQNRMWMQRSDIVLASGVKTDRTPRAMNRCN